MRRLLSSSLLSVIAACHCGSGTTEPDSGPDPTDADVLEDAGPDRDAGQADAGFSAIDRFSFNGRDYAAQVDDLEHVHAAGESLTVEWQGAGDCTLRKDNDVVGQGAQGQIDPLASDGQVFTLTCGDASVSVTLRELTVGSFTLGPDLFVAVIDDAEAGTVTVDASFVSIPEHHPTCALLSTTLDGFAASLHSSDAGAPTVWSATLSRGDTFGLFASCTDDALPPNDTRVAERLLRTGKIYSPFTVSSTSIDYEETIDLFWDAEGFDSCRVLGAMTEVQSNANFEPRGAARDSLRLTRIDDFQLSCLFDGMEVYRSPSIEVLVFKRVDRFFLLPQGRDLHISWTVAPSASDGCNLRVEPAGVDLAVNAPTSGSLLDSNRSGRLVYTLECLGGPGLRNGRAKTAVIWGNVYDAGDISLILGDPPVSVVTGSVQPTGIADFDTARLVSLEVVGYVFTYINNNGTELHLPVLRDVGGGFEVSVNPLLTRVVAPQLRSPAGFNIIANDALTTLTVFPDAAACAPLSFPCAATGDLQIFNNPALPTTEANLACGRVSTSGIVNIRNNLDDGATPAGSCP